MLLPSSKRERQEDKPQDKPQDKREDKLGQHSGEEPQMNLLVLPKPPVEQEETTSEAQLESSAVFGSHFPLSFQPPASPSGPRATSLLRGAPSKPSLHPKGSQTPRKPFPSPRSKAELLTSQTFFPMAAGKSLHWLLIQLGQNYCRESLLLPSPPCKAIPREGRFHGDPLLDCI